MYEWMRVLSRTHSYFADNHVLVDKSDGARGALHSLENKIYEEVEISESASARSIDDDVIAEQFGEEYADDGSGVPIISKSAVLKDVDGLDLSTRNAAVEAMILILDKKSENGVEFPLVTVHRGEEPITEWSQNGDMIAAAFPCLFMRGGKHLPSGTWPASLIKHLMRYYDGRFEKHTALVAMLFNQLQRHTAVRRAAHIGSSRAAVLVQLGKLANSKKFYDVLVSAKQNPESRQAKRVNGYLLRILSLVGGCIPFSPFERATTRPKIGALRARYGIPQHWVTIAPPEHHNLELHRVAALRKTNAWNQPDIIFQRRQCTQNDLPASVRCGSRGRLVVSNMYPALAARVFDRCTKQILNDIVMCRAASDTRISRDYAQRETGAYGVIAAFAAVVEPQVDGRLHMHMTLYGSKFNPSLLSRIMCSPVLCERAARWLESICCTRLDNFIHSWREKCLAQDRSMPKAFDIELPDPLVNFEAFLRAAKMRVATTNFHSHTNTCFKGNRGKYMCRLARPAGKHDGATCPLQILRERKGDTRAGVAPIVIGCKLKSRVHRAIDHGYSYAAGEAFRSHGEGPLLWELRRPEADTKVVETNLVLAALTASHTNSSFINGEDSGDMIEEYQQAYMTKDDVSLKGAASALLSAVDHNLKYPSRADDSQSDVRIGKYLATRTVNSFSGAREWSHALMVYAITGHRSFLSSDTFWYIFPFALVEYVKCLRGKINTPPTSGAPSDCVDDELLSVENNLASIVDKVNEEDNSKSSSAPRVAGTGVRTFKSDGEIVFVTQAESYYNRGSNFVDFSPLEFECIVDVVPVAKRKATKKTGPGRPARDGFAFGTAHPLFQTHVGVIRAKFLTPVFGGAPPPTWGESTGTGNGDSKRDQLAQYLLCAFTSWNSQGPRWSFDAAGILDMCESWDRRSAPIVNRERCRYVRNIMKKGYRSSRNEGIASDWRNRGADYWKQSRPSSKCPPTNAPSQPTDPEFDGVLPARGDLYELLTRVAAGSASRRSGIASLKATFASVLDENTISEDCPNSAGAAADTSTPMEHSTSPKIPVFQFTTSNIPGGGLRSLSRVASSVQSFQPDQPFSNCEPNHNCGDSGCGTGNAYRSDGVEGDIDSSGLSKEQYAVVKTIIDGIDRGEQTLTVLHGGGGTGKSFVVRRICELLHQRGYEVVSTCPTGAGACQLINGRTFHSALKCSKKGNRLSAQSAAFLSKLFGPNVALIVVDEIAMLKAKYLALLDERLRMLYRNDLPFGGKSILLTGDFWQLQVVRGVSLCKCMYMHTNDPVLLQARYLFSQFTVCTLRKQQRASECPTQQALLERFRRLPRQYPEQNRWTQNDNYFHPIDEDMTDILTRPLTREDVAADDSWLSGSVLLVTSNMDRAVLNTCMAVELAQRSQHLLYRWKKRLSKDVPDFIQELLYNEAEHPELFGYFYYGAPGQILDNANGNVTLGAANGTRCWFHSLGWDDNEVTDNAVQLTKDALRCGKSLVELPVAPEYINVRLADRDGNLLDATSWPSDANLETESRCNEEEAEHASVIIPIGVARLNNDNFTIKLDDLGKDSSSIGYEQHAVDLALALTVWKAQGSTFDRVICLLDGSANAPAWQFEHLYVAASRVRTSVSLRCLHTTLVPDKKKLLGMRPNIFTVKWILDLDKNGRWKSPSARKQSSNKIV